MSRTQEQFDEIADKVAAVRGDFLNKGDFADSDVASMNAEVAKILSDNKITAEEFDAGLEQRVFPYLTNTEKVVD